MAMRGSEVPTVRTQARLRRSRRQDFAARYSMTDTTAPVDVADPGYHPGADPALRRQIEDALDLIRPYLMTDGGSVRLVDVTPDMVVELELLGACGTCPMSTMTLRAGIEQALRRSVPSITRVEAVSAR